jgi:hypothetical protein
MLPVRIKTETGSVYEIDPWGLCRKTDIYGRHVDTFKPFIMKPVPGHVTTLEEIYELPEGDPVIGQRLYLSGLKSWWITTEVVSVKHRRIYPRLEKLAQKSVFLYYKVLFTIDRWRRFRKGSAKNGI